MNDLRTRMEEQLSQTLSQNQIQSLEILAMDVVELQKFLENEYIENPLMDQKNSNANQEDFMTNIDQFKSWYDDQYTNAVYKGEVSAEEEKQHSEKELKEVDEKEDIKVFLISQLDRGDFSSGEWKIIDFLIDCLEVNGYFLENSGEIASKLKVPVDEIDKCLERLRMLEPYGIFASDLTHCLIRQLEARQILTPELEQMVRYHLEDVSRGKINVISRSLEISTNRVRQLIQVIKTLNPCPVTDESRGKTEFIVPDIYFEYIDAKWNVKMNDSAVSNYSINEFYLKMMRDTKDPELFNYFKKKLERASFILNCMEQRRKTLLLIAEGILDIQKDYFLGIAPLRPMNMAELADTIHVHPSTVSRACKGKYVHYPAGTIMMRKLFSTSIVNSGDLEAVSQQQIKTMIKNIVSEENPCKPYSDMKIAKLLEQQKIVVSRRTVTKYREELGIAGSFERKDI